MSPARRSPDATEELRSSLLDLAQGLVARDGPSGLTMRSLAAEAGCAVGLIYKVFANREDLVVELISREFLRLRGEFDRLVADAGTDTVAGNLARYAELLLSSPAARLGHSIDSEELALAIDAKAHQSGVVAALETTVADYLAAEQRLGRVDGGVDTQAFGFVISGAVHNLLVSGDPYPRPTRRRLAAMLAGVAARLEPPPTRGGSNVPSRTDANRADVVSDALDRLADYAFVDGPGMATHGPMAAEALATLGHADEVAGWVERYKQRHAVIAGPPAVEHLDPADEASWRPALGDPSRLADWDALFARQLAEAPWAAVLAAWVPTLLAGYGGAFTHGLIRTAHAVRSLDTSPEPSSLQLGELAKGLAYWAGTHKVLPGRPALEGPLSLEDAIAGLPRPTEPWNPMEAGMFTRLPELPGFATAVEALGPPASLDDALGDLTSAFARMLVANPDGHPFGLVHALTPVAGARTLLRYAPTVSTGQVYARLWQVNAAIAAGFVPSPGHAVPESDPLSPDELVALAVEHQDPHVVKFTEAAVGEYRRRPDPAYLHAARHVLTTTPAW